MSRCTHEWERLNAHCIHCGLSKLTILIHETTP